MLDQQILENTTVNEKFKVKYVLERIVCRVHDEKSSLFQGRATAAAKYARSSNEPTHGTINYV